MPVCPFIPPFMHPFIHISMHSSMEQLFKVNNCSDESLEVQAKLIFCLKLTRKTSQDQLRPNE